MPYTNSDSIYIKTPSKGYINALGYSGPLVYPVKVPISSIYSLVLTGFEVYEVDINDKRNTPKRSILLTLENLYDDKKFEKMNNGKDIKFKEPDKSLSITKTGEKIKSDESSNPSVIIKPPEIDPNEAAHQVEKVSAPEDTSIESNNVNDDNFSESKDEQTTEQDDSASDTNKDEKNSIKKKNNK